VAHQVGGLTAQKVFADAEVAALAEAACRGDLEAVNRAVHAGANVNGRGLEGISPLAWALSCENLAGMEALIRSGADPNRGDDNGTTVVYYAATYHNRELLALLLRLGGDPNHMNNSGYTPLEAAMRHYRATGNIANLELFLEAGADTSVTNGGGDTVVDIAAMRNQYDLVYRFLQAGYRGDHERLLRYALTGAIDPSSQQARWRDRVIAELQGGETATDLEHRDVD